VHGCLDPQSNFFTVTLLLKTQLSRTPRPRITGTEPSLPNDASPEAASANVFSCVPCLKCNKKLHKLQRARSLLVGSVKSPKKSSLYMLNSSDEYGGLQVALPQQNQEQQKSKALKTIKREMNPFIDSDAAWFELDLGLRRDRDSAGTKEAKRRPGGSRKRQLISSSSLFPWSPHWPSWGGGIHQ
jgi:hypothetical protein